MLTYFTFNFPTILIAINPNIMAKFLIIMCCGSPYNTLKAATFRTKFEYITALRPLTGTRLHTPSN